MTEWFSERGNGIGQDFEVTERLAVEQTRFQQLEIYQTRCNGRLLVLDGVIQLVESDEFVYHEMLVNLAAMAHPAPRRALVIGGGDGGAVRELARHRELERIDWCEIDVSVVEQSRRWLPRVAAANDDCRVHLSIGDGSEFIRTHESAYDLVIVDSTDPGGVAEPLFGEEFYRAVRRALRPGGIVSSQSESVFLLPQVVHRLHGITERVFGASHYAMFYVPSYPTGMIGACVASRDGAEVRRPVREAAPDLLQAWRYYAPAVHEAAFVLPPFARERVERG